MTKELESKKVRVAEGALLEDVPDPVRAMEELRAKLQGLKNKPLLTERVVLPKIVADDMHSRMVLRFATNSLYGKLGSSPDGSLILGPDGEPIYPKHR